MFVERQFRLGKFLKLVPPVSNGPGRKPLSFHAISFGKDASETTLRRMADLALNLQNNASRPAPATVPSSFATALNTVSTHVSGIELIQTKLIHIRYGSRKHSWELRSR